MLEEKQKNTSLPQHQTKRINKLSFNARLIVLMRKEDTPYHCNAVAPPAEPFNEIQLCFTIDNSVLPKAPLLIKKMSLISCIVFFFRDRSWTEANLRMCGSILFVYGTVRKKCKNVYNRKTKTKTKKKAV